MADIDEINDAIVTNATGPKRVQVGTQSVEQHTIEDQIKAAQYVSGQDSAAQPHMGLRFTKLLSPGAQ